MSFSLRGPARSLTSAWGSAQGLGSTCRIREEQPELACCGEVRRQPQGDLSSGLPETECGRLHFPNVTTAIAPPAPRHALLRSDPASLQEKSRWSWFCQETRRPKMEPGSLRKAELTRHPPCESELFQTKRLPPDTVPGTGSASLIA